MTIMTNNVSDERMTSLFVIENGYVLWSQDRSLHVFRHVVDDTLPWLIVVSNNVVSNVDDGGDDLVGDN